jgi:hypothetical protein
MKKQFIELEVYDYLYRKSCSTVVKSFNIDHIISFYKSNDHEFNSDTFIVLTHNSNKDEPIRVKCTYEHLRSIVSYE